MLLLVSVALAGCLGAQTPASGSDADNATAPGGNATPAGEAGFDVADRPHVHDFWGNGSRKPLMTRTVTVEATQDQVRVGDTVQAGVRGCDDGGTLFGNLLETCIGRAVFGVPAADGDRAIVPPGTAAVEASLSWEDPTITGIHLQYQPAFRPGWRTFDVFDQSGQTKAVRASQYDPSWDHLPLDWTDDGHSRQSQWLFAVTAYGADAPAGLARGDVTVDVSVERTDGELPVEPPHPDWYGGNSSYRIANLTTEAGGGPQIAYSSSFGYRFHLYPESAVPPGSKQILIAVDHPNQAPTSAADPTRPEYTLLYSTNATYIPFEQGDAGTAEVASDSPERTVFKIPIEPTMTDSIYTCHRGETRWRFMLWIHGPEIPNPFFDRSGSAFAWYQGDLGISGGVTERAGPEDPDDLAMGRAQGVEGCSSVKEAQT